MKTLNKLQITTERLMKDEELITLKGGYDGCGNFLCNCYGVPDAWWKCYCTTEAMEIDVAQRCGGLGGYCSNAGSC